MPQQNAAFQGGNGMPRQNGSASTPTWNAQTQQLWNDYNNHNNNQALQQKKTKKKKTPIVIGVVAAIVAVLVCVGVFFVMPLIKAKKTVDPNKQGADILKAESAQIETMLNKALTSGSVLSSASTNRVVGSFTVDKALFDNTDLLSYLNVNTIQYDIQFDAAKQKINGTIGLAQGSGQPVLTLQYYTDGKKLYMKAPQLLDSSLTADIEMDSDVDFSTAAGVLGTMDASVLNQYMEVLQSIIKHMVVGINDVIDNCRYIKSEGTVALSYGDISINAAYYDVTVTKSALIGGFNKAVDAMFDDSEIAPYITMLAAVGARMDRESMKADFAKELDHYQDVHFVMYTKEDKFCGVSLDVAQFGEGKKGKVEIVFPEKNYVGVTVKDEKEDSTVVMKFDARKQEKILMMDVNTSKSSGKLTLKYEADSSKVQIHELSIEGKNGDKTNVNMKFSMTQQYMSNGTITMSEADFPNAIDMEKMTNQEMTKLRTEILGKADVLYQIFSEKFIKGSI